MDTTFLEVNVYDSQNIPKWRVIVCFFLNKYENCIIILEITWLMLSLYLEGINNFAAIR